MQQRQWVLKPQPAQEALESLKNSINVSDAIATMLLQRGIQDFDQAKTYFNPSIDTLHDPFLMADMQKAVDRLYRAIAQKEKIMIYGDYDVDGTTSVAMVYSFLSKHYPNLTYYIPDRYQEGYGVSIRGIDYANKQGITLIISLDCGIKAAEKISYAKERGIDFIVCDHHTVPAELPPAVAVLDPKRPDCNYPYKELTGCGVGFKFLQAFVSYSDLPASELMMYLDYVAVSTACDIVPITGENRVLAKYGVDLLSENPRTGFKAMLEVAGMKRKLTVTDLVFGIGPRINAAGRIAHANAAVELLISEDETQAFEFARSVNQKNNTRKDYDSAMTEEALAMIEEMGWQEAKSTLLYKEDWHKGVVGITASRCTEHYYRPTIILTESNGKAAGSARSVKGFNVYNAIDSCSDLLTQFGGHDFAAGMTLPIENIPAFRQKFEEVVSATITEDQLIPKINIDSVIPLDRISWKFFHIIQRMAPFGPNNLQPLFMAERVYLASPARLLKELHLKIRIKQGNQAFDCIGFNMPHYFPELLPDRPFSICFHIDENYYRGQSSLQLRIKDLKFD